MKKFIPFLFVGILVLSGFGTVAIVLEKLEYKTSSDLLDDELDQSQTELEAGVPIGNFQIQDKPRLNWTVAQSYIPSKDIQTRIQLLFSRNSTPLTIYPLVVCIREYLTGENIGMLSIEPEEVPEFPDFFWIEFDFDDMYMTVGHSYFIVCYTTNETDNCYLWAGNGSNLYSNGQVYFSFDDGATWDSGPPWDTADMCFMTYGRDNNPPNKPVKPSGSTSGKLGIEYTYTTITTDPDGDQVYYNWSWGDNTYSEWLGPYDSGINNSAKHIWNNKGTYQIKVKAKDVYDAESDWSDPLLVTMPKNKAINFNYNLLEWLFERYPSLFPILRYLMEL